MNEILYSFFLLIAIASPIILTIWVFQIIRAIWHFAKFYDETM